MHGRKNPHHPPNPKSPPTASADCPALPAFLTVHPDGVTLAIKAQPRAAKNEILFTAANDPELRVRIIAPPVDAAANEALLQLLAETFTCPRRNVALIRGLTSRHKTVKVLGLTASHAITKLDTLKR